MTRRVCVIPGDDAVPETVLPSLGVLKAMELDLEYEVLPSGGEGLARYGRDDFARVCREAIDSCDTTLFGSTSGKTPALGYLRWQKGAYANLRPVRYMPCARSPLAHPDGIDFVIVRENMEDLYAGVEGDLGVLEPLGFSNMLTREPLPTEGRKFALKVITEHNTRRIVEFACNVAREVVAGCPDLAYEDFIIDDFARRIVASPHDLDVVVLPNLYGDILSDEASALVGGLGVAPSDCYTEGFSYFEPVHGSAPDIAGKHIINPTATLLSAVMMLDWLSMAPDARRLEDAVEAVYREGKALTPDQGGTATSDDFCAAVRDRL